MSSICQHVAVVIVAPKKIELPWNGNQRYHLCRMTDYKNILVGGATKQGKTSLLKFELSALLKEGASYNRIIIVLDPKKSGEYDEFDGQVQIYKRLLEIESVLIALEGRIYSREQGESPVPRIYLFIDEYADLVPGEYMGETANTHLDITQHSVLTIAKKGPLHGITVFLATNRLKKEVLTEELLNCFPIRVCFRVALKVESDLLLHDCKNGAELLTNAGEMLIQDPWRSSTELIRLEDLKG